MGKIMNCKYCLLFGRIWCPTLLYKQTNYHFLVLGESLLESETSLADNPTALALSPWAKSLPPVIISISSKWHTYTIHSRS